MEMIWSSMAPTQTQILRSFETEPRARPWRSSCCAALPVVGVPPGAKAAARLPGKKDHELMQRPGYVTSVRPSSPTRSPAAGNNNAAAASASRLNEVVVATSSTHGYGGDDIDMGLRRQQHRHWAAVTTDPVATMTATSTWVMR